MADADDIPQQDDLDSQVEAQITPAAEPAVPPAEGAVTQPSATPEPAPALQPEPVVSRAEYEWAQRQLNDLRRERDQLISTFQSGQRGLPPTPTVDDNMDPQTRAFWEQQRRTISELINPIAQRLDAQDRILQAQRAERTTESIVADTRAMVMELNTRMPAVRDDPDLGRRVADKVEKAVRSYRANGDAPVTPEMVRHYYDDIVSDYQWAASRAHAKQATDARAGAPGAKVPALKGGAAPPAGGKPKEIDYDNYEDREIIANMRKERMRGRK